MKNPLIKYYLTGFGLADDVPVELSVNEVLNLIELQQIENPALGQIFEMVEWCIDYLKGIDNEIVRVKLNELKKKI